MAKQLTSMQFVNKLKECVKEYKKQMLDTRDEHDAAYFFDSKLKKFLIKHSDELDAMATMNFEKQFMSWTSLYLLVDEHD